MIATLAETALTTLVAVGIVAGVAGLGAGAWYLDRRRRTANVCRLLQGHFGSRDFEGLRTHARNFPGYARPDVQRALDALLSGNLRIAHQTGLAREHFQDTLRFSTLMVGDVLAPKAAPPSFEEVPIGEGESVRCLTNGLWLIEDGSLRFAVLLSQQMVLMQAKGIHVEIVVPVGEAGETRVRAFFEPLEKAVADSRSYRGKVLSLDRESDFGGRSPEIQVHKLREVRREEIILPEKTMALLDRNVLKFAEYRERLIGLGQPARKGVLFYGPPGTGKTHTIHWLAGELKGHTTFLVTSDQIALLAEYMTLARLLQPSVVVVEDVDLAAKDRAESGLCEQGLLTRLLNEMDGLKPDARILFILTSNRPEVLEPALASRPGRVDQAIEFPLPDDEGRRRLVRLYAKGMEMDPEAVSTAVQKTRGASAAFIKEMMRRAAQAHLEGGSPEKRLSPRDLEEAIQEMVFSGGKLNLSLLGGSAIGFRTDA